MGRFQGREGELTSLGEHTTMYERLYPYFQRMGQDRTLRCCDSGLPGTRVGERLKGGALGVGSEDT